MVCELSAPALPIEVLLPPTQTARPGMDGLEEPEAGEDAAEDNVVEEPPSVSA